MKIQSIDDWNNLKHTNNFSDISTELLGYVARQISEQIVDKETGETKRDTEQDYLISQFFMNNITRDPARPETIYDQRYSESFIRKLNEAIEDAKEKGDSERIENLSTILQVAHEVKTGIEREQSSRVIAGFRYETVNGKKNLVGDEKILFDINRFFDDLGKEASAGFALKNSIYVYLTNAKDKEDLLKRMEVITVKLEEYEKEKTGQSLDEVNRAIELAVNDYRNDDIRGIDKNVDER